VPHAVLTTHLQRFFPTLPARVEVGAGTVAGVVKELDLRWPGLGFYLTDERGQLRKHVAVWVDGERLQDRERLTDVVRPDGEVHVLQALSGG
jgi:sulfur carrier protein ThiS